MIIISITGLILFALAGLVVHFLDLWVGIGFFLLAFGGFILQGLVKIPADPPTNGILTVWGKRQRVIKDEGWRFFPFRGFWHDFILVKVVKVNQKLSGQVIRTPDLARLEVPISLTWTPCDFIEFLNSGGEEGVKAILLDIVQERLREWTFSQNEGPQNWKEVLGAQEEATAILLKSILGDRLPQIPSRVPTPILFKYFNDPQKPPTESEKAVWGDSWAEVTKILAQENESEVKQAVKQRRKQVALAGRGSGDFKPDQLGIVINRLNVGEIKLSGRLEEASDLKVKEAEEQTAEVLEIDHLIERIQKLMKPVSEGGLGMTVEEARETFQTERGKVVKIVSEGRLNVSPETRAMVEKVFPGIVSFFRR